MISGNDEQARLAPQSLEVFLDDNDLNIGVQSTSDIEEISADCRHVVWTCVREQRICRASRDFTDRVSHRTGSDSA
jgi:hypothetical protein